MTNSWALSKSTVWNTIYYHCHQPFVNGLKDFLNEIFEKESTVLIGTSSPIENSQPVRAFLKND